MCYSKEVSLITATGILIPSSYLWLRLNSTASSLKIKLRSENLRPFFTYLVLGLAAIGGHDFFQFLSIWTGNQFIYKLGLLSSISAVFFLTRALEKIRQQNLGSQFILGSIFALFAYMLTKDMPFENQTFWVRGHSHTLWAIIWLFWYLYYNFLGLYLTWTTRSPRNRWLFGTSVLVFQNISFYLAIAYALLAVQVQDGNFARCSQWQELTSFTFFKDFPSIWCLFAVLQVPFVFLALYLFNRFYQSKKGWVTKNIPTLHLVGIAGLALGCMALIAYYIPILFAVSWKMVSF